jgi:flagellar motor switch/type III secretory pathway protein FliN
MATKLAFTKEIAVPITEDVWDEAGWLPCVLSVDLTLKRFTVRDLLQLESGTILETTNTIGADVPVLVNSQLIGWAEFEVVGQRLGVRLTEIER